MSIYDATPYLAGNYAPVAAEVTAFDLPVTGSIPAELEGRFLRNGPNPRETPDMENHHWFLGDGMVHGLRLGGGKAQWYRNRYVQPDAAFGPNTNVIGHAGKTLAIVEAGPQPVELDDELNHIGVTDLGGLPSGFTAHPKLDPLTGELHAVNYHWPDQMDKVHYVVVDADGQVSKSVPIHTPTMPMIHDMALTQTYAAIFDLPVAVNIELAIAGNPFPLTWHHDYNARIGLLPRDADSGDDVIWCEIDPCFAYHPMNSYDRDDGCVVIDICEYDSMFDTDRNGPFRDSMPRLARWIADPSTGKVSRETLDDAVHEFPRVSNAVATLPYRYGYTAGDATGTGEWFGTTVKHDMVAGSSQTRVHGGRREPGEPVFVSREHGTAEDDGWLMMFVYDPDRNSSSGGATDLVILDATDITGDEVARVELPQRVPNGFHGNWVAG